MQRVLVCATCSLGFYKNLGNLVTSLFPHSSQTGGKAGALKLGYFVPQFPGQTHIFFWREIAELEARGVEVHLLSTRLPPTGLISHSWSKAAIDRTEYLMSRDPFKMLWAARAQNWSVLLEQIRAEKLPFAKDVAVCLPAATRLKAYSRTNQLDHVHVHSCGRAALIAAMARKMGGPEYSVTLHGPLADYGPGQKVKWAGAEFATVITQKLLGEIRQSIGAALPDRIYVRPMGVNTEVLNRKSPYVPIQPGMPLRLFSCGRLNRIKGHQDLMQAVRILLDRGRNVILEIAGEDDAGGSGYRGELERQIGNLGLEGHVHLLGAIDAGRVVEKLCSAHIFVLASWNEPLGVAYMEAMSCGVPTIATDSGGVSEMITNGETALLVPPKAPEFLANSIDALADDPDLAVRLSHAGRSHMIKHYHSGLGAQTLIDGIHAASKAREEI